jgi:hypothetical protein
MRLGYIKDEYGNLVRKWIEEGQERNPEFLFFVGATFGDYIWTDEKHIEEAKENLLEQMISALRELAKNDEFWIVQSPSYWNNFSHQDNLVDPVPQEAKEGKSSVAWNIHLPQMAGYYPWDEAERLTKKIDECFISK